MKLSRGSGKRVAACCAGLATIAFVIASAAAAPGGLREVEEQGAASLSNAEGVAVSPNGRYVYGVGFASDDVVAFARNASTGAITFDNAVDGSVDGLDGPNGVAVAPDGDHLYVPGDNSDTIHTFEVQPDGDLNNIDSELDNDGAIDGLEGAFDAIVSPNGDHVYVTGAAEDKIGAFHRGSDGELAWFDTYIDGLEDIVNLDDPRGIAMSPNGKNLYVASNDDGAVLTFRSFPDTGQLDFVESDAGFFSPVNDVEVSRDGTRVYAAFDSGVRTFRRNTSTGALSLIGLTPSDPPAEPLASVFGLAASPDGGHVYASVDSLDEGVATLRTRANAALDYQELDSISEFIDPSDVAVSGDGRHVYLSGGSVGDGHIAAYSRQPEVDLRGKRKQGANKLVVKADCTADCRVTLKAKGYKTVRKQLKATRKPRRLVLKAKGDGPSGEKTTAKAKARAGNRSDADKLKIKFR